MTPLRERIAADQRLVILRILNEAPGYCTNDSVIDMSMGMIGHRIPRDTVQTHLHWLEEQGLIELEAMGEILVATLAGRGQDVATGEATVPGVNRPRAGR